MIVFFHTGGPGSGKKEVAKKIAAQYKLVHLSAGELLRSFSELEAQESKDVAKLILAGSLVPQEVILKVMQDEVKKNSEADGFVVDGFPRTVEQAESFVSEVGRHCSPELYLDFFEIYCCKQINLKIDAHFKIKCSTFGNQSQLV